jgi:hypothetical protein
MTNEQDETQSRLTFHDRNCCQLIRKPELTSLLRCYIISPYLVELSNHNFAVRMLLPSKQNLSSGTSPTQNRWC